MTPNEARDALIARRADLLGRIAGIDDRLDDPVDRDSEEAAIETEDDQMLQTLGAVERAEVARIDAALDRIANGSWGVCVKCGEPIAEKRLATLPETPFCASCAG
ncbi:MAG: TraR/DksA family transcriptional regulator [Rhodobacteraceae bacterium]|nr:TraR/DksA family transcriptional regulator [Paracoccaceae bacterium]